MKKFKQIIIAALFFLMILFPETTIAGTKKGLQLWYHFVLPALFPFMICCSLLISTGAIPILSYPFYVILSPFFNLSLNGCFVLFSGLFCGYPVGAKNCCDLYQSQKICRKEASFLLSISNHPSPMFLVGYLTGLLPSQHDVYPFLLSIYLSLIPLMFLSKKFYKISRMKKSDVTIRPSDSFNFNESIIQSFDSIVCIGIYIMLFSIIACFLKGILSSDCCLYYILLAMCEMTTGTRSASEGYAKGILSSNLCVCILLVSVITGAISGILQTNSVIKNAGLSIRHYIFWKFLQSTISCIIFILLRLLPVYHLL